MEDARRRAADEKVLRIDHSDVYLENDRLSEELGKSLDTIFRAKHRTVINHLMNSFNEVEVILVQQESFLATGSCVGP
ncbi:hypothetical protein C0Q70_10943 [Pomacea canaliculata]|uniref:Uncharacterized protein n=1 Tax=Pomacea canaliculata TaxID=400727 RepID=A0A2T7P4L9_POMCA|nr:hypothetical protein C0Q70_10943 [Pomacea canaliculata]